MTTFEDFKAKCSEIKKATQDYESLLSNSLTEFYRKYVESFVFPGDSFIDKNGKSRSFVTLMSKRYSGNSESVAVDIHDGISVNIFTIIDNSDLNNLIEERFHLNIRLVNGGVSYKVTDTGFFDEKEFQDVKDEKSYLEVINYIKFAFMRNVLKNYPGVQEHLDAE